MTASNFGIALIFKVRLIRKGGFPCEEKIGRPKLDC